MDHQIFFSIKRPEVVDETIEGETVIVNLDNGVYYSLRFSGAEIWNCLENGANLDECVASLASRFEATPQVIRTAVEQLLISLQEEGLVKVSADRPGTAPSPLPVAAEKLKFEAPIFEKYSDMQELLLLDPIHEVDEEGWPHKEEGEHDDPTRQ